jgi:hypothetical protein
MVSVLHPKHLDIKQESTSYDVAASELLYPLNEIVDIVDLLSKKKKEKIEKGKWINQKTEIAVFIDLSASVEMT